MGPGCQKSGPAKTGPARSVLPPLLPANHVAQCSELIYWQHKYSAGMIIQAIVNVF